MAALALLCILKTRSGGFFYGFSQRLPVIHRQRRAHSPHN